MFGLAGASVVTSYSFTYAAWRTHKPVSLKAEAKALILESPTSAIENAYYHGQ